MKKHKMFFGILVPEEKLRNAMELYPGKTRNEVREILYREIKKKLLPGFAVSVFFLLLATCTGQRRQEEGILRPEPGKEPVSVQIQINLETGVAKLPLRIGALEYEENRIEELHREAEKYLEEAVKGENISFENVVQDLVFPTTLPLTGGDIVWSTDAPWLVTTEGKVLNHGLDASEAVEITARISYGSESRIFSKVITVFPMVHTEEELLLQKVQRELALWEKETRTRERIFLPEEVMGYPIQHEKDTVFGTGSFMVVLAVVIPLLLYFGYYEKLDTRRKKKKEQAEGCYPEFVTKLSLLLMAGISVRQSFVRLAEEYEKNYGPDYVLTKELRVIKQELETGRSEAVVYEDFGRRIGVPAYRRMASLLTQSISKGVQGMKSLLLQEVTEVMAQEKALIRQKGEQAGTKLLLPMMGMLLLMFAILLVPAFQSF